MNQRFEDEEQPGQKRRRLDELFADEPFLSPTMKARRLHEKLDEQAGDFPDLGASQAAQGLPAEAYVRSVSERPEPAPLPVAPSGITPDAGAPAVSLIDAAIFLRSHGQQAPRTVGSAARENLIRFRDMQLLTWARAVEER
jgi:hypothetical protein